MKTKTLHINQKRLIETLNVSASIGTTKNKGLHRLALTQEDKTMREKFIYWLKKENLDVRVDDFGNIYGKREGKNKDAPSIAMGSHLDTQPKGGRFDGILGVLAGLEIIRVLNENNIETEHSIEIINFTNEEGARFSPPMLGSGGATKTFSKEFVYQSMDEQGVTYKQALKQIGFKGEETNRFNLVKNFIELHIEQGPVLESNHKEIGVVQGIQGMNWLSVNVQGESNHAGPTPMDNRKDALNSSLKMIFKINDITKKIKGLKTTVGKLDVFPNVPNVIPGEVEFSIDIRHEEDKIRKSAIESLKENISTVALIDNVDITIATDWDSTAVNFSEEIINNVERGAKEYGYSSMPIFSGPGHDSKYMANITNTGMIFIPSKAGISHNEAELSSDDDIVKGANVLLYIICNLAQIKN